jgi:cobyrinic acid a,c-diamide synthase
MGVVFNRVGSKRHYTMLQEACEDIGVKCFGYLSNLKNIEIPSRHLGLNIQEIEKFDSVIDLIADELEKTLDWNAILKVSKEVNTPPPSIQKTTTKNITFAIAKDEAFNFIYPHNINAMKQLGKVIFFSPIHDTEIPNCDFIFLPGGYPEAHLKELSANTSMLESIKTFAENNGQIYAECGGMMYLGKSIISENNTAFKMVNYFDFESTIADKKLHLGYRTTKTNNHIFKGHEFHYSSLQNDHETTINATVLNARDGETDTKIHKKNKVIASYIHHYFGTPEILLQLINELNNNV